MTTDELRAKFEAHHGLTWKQINALGISEGSKMHLRLDYERNFETWQAAHASRDVEVEALRKDAERLTWFETQREAYGFEDVHEGNRWTIEGPFNTLREAIDAAMREESK